MMHGQGVDLLEEATGGDALRSVRDEDVLADVEIAMLGQVAGNEVGRPRRDRRAQDQAVSRGEHPQQVVERRADVTHVDLDMREGRGAQRDHDVARARGVGDALGERQTAACVHPIEQILPARLGERHPPFAHGVQPRRVVVDPRHREAAVGERQGQRQTDAAKADDGHLGGAMRRRSCKPRG